MQDTDFKALLKKSLLWCYLIQYVIQTTFYFEIAYIRLEKQCRFL